MLNPNEKQLLSIIKKEPFMSQQDIATAMNLPRSTIATLISNLVQKEVILGRAYIIKDPADIIVIGGMNIDRKYVIRGKTIPYTSNPVSSTQSVGGVGRNIAENLGRMGKQVKLVSVAGHDHDYQWIKDQSQAYIDMDHVTQLANHATGAYSAILDQQGEMQLALADMDIYDRMDLSWLKDHEALLSTASMLVIDLNLTAEAVQYMVSLAKNKNIPLFVIPVSSPKMDRLPKDLNGVHTLIVNLDESASYFQQPMGGLETSNDLARLWMDTGIQQVVMTQGSRPCLYANQEGIFKRFHPPKVDRVVDVTGAGDSFVAGFIYGQAEGEDYESSIQLALTNSYHTIQSQLTVRPNLTADGILKEKNQLF